MVAGVDASRSPATANQRGGAVDPNPVLITFGVIPIALTAGKRGKNVTLPEQRAARADLREFIGHQVLETHEIELQMCFKPSSLCKQHFCGRVGRSTRGI